MRLLKIGILFFALFVASIYAAFFFEDTYCKGIRYLYETLSTNHLSFFHPTKYLHFASGQFVLTYGLFNVLWMFLLRRQTKKQIIKSVLSGIILFICSTIVFCYVNGSLKLVECTACEGKRVLSYDDINYDMVFLVGLVSAIIPAVITALNLYRSKKGHMNKLPEDISDKIEAFFVSEKDKQEAISILSDVFKRDWNVGSDQLTRSLLVLSEGKIDLLKAELDFDDPRDVIMKAEQHEGNPGHYFIQPFKAK